MPREVRSGERYGYVIRVSNVADTLLTDVVVHDTLPKGFEVSEGTPKAAAADGRATWRLGELEKDGSKTLRASGIAGEPGEARHVAYATYNVPLTGVASVAAPKLKLERTVPHLVVFGSALRISYVVTNEALTGRVVAGTARAVSVRRWTSQTEPRRGAAIALRIKGSCARTRTRFATCRRRRGRR